MKPVNFSTRRSAVLDAVKRTVRFAVVIAVRDAMEGATWGFMGNAVWNAVEEEVL